MRTKFAAPRSRSGLTLTITAVLDAVICADGLQVIDHARGHLVDVAVERDISGDTPHHSASRRATSGRSVAA